MYFATNPPPGTLPAQIAREYRELRDAQPSMRLFALVDCAFEEAFLKARYRRTLPSQSLYGDTSLKALGAAAPHLLTAPDGVAEQQAWLSHVFACCQGKPMLSLIASPLDGGGLVSHWRPYLIAMTPDTVEWPVRWGDTRVLPALVDALTEAQRQHFFAPLARWWSPARDGGLLQWQGAGASPIPAGFDKLPLSDEVFGKLVDMAEADAVLANLYDKQPYLFEAASPAECHGRVARHLALASAHGIHAAPAREQFSALALMLADDFTRHAAMAQLLRRTRQGADFHHEIAALPDAFWRQAVSKLPVSDTA